MAAVLVFVVTTLLVWLISVGFTKYIEPLGKWGEQYVESKFAKKRS